MTKKKLKIVIPGGLDIDFKKYLENNFKSKGVLSNYNIVSVNKKPGELTRELFDADVFITTRWPNKNINAPKLKLIQIPAAGFDNIHFESVPKGCKVSNTFEHEVPIAEYCLLAMLEAEINLNKMNAQLKKGNWNGYFTSSSFHGELFNKNLGILGYGHIGKEIAKRAKAFNMEIHYHNRSKLSPELEDGAIYHKDLKSLFKQSEFLSINCPATPETTKLVNKETLSYLEENTVVGNAARGDIVDDDAMIEALKSGKVFAYGLDVYNGEPKIHPEYLKLKNIFLLPHLGSATKRTRWDMAFRATKNLEDFFSGNKPQDQVN